MARQPRVVAELGRPETPQETAARKAEASRRYRSSQTFRNLITALVVTLIAVAVLLLAVPRGQAPERAAIDVAAAAEQATVEQGRPLVTPDAPESWTVNDAQVRSGRGAGAAAWTVIYATEGSGFVRVSQGFGTDDRWASSVVGGLAPSDSITIDGVAWDVYEPRDPAAAGNISYALGTQAGDDHVLVYGYADAETVQQIAATVTDDIAMIAQHDRETQAP